MILVFILMIQMLYNVQAVVDVAAEKKHGRRVDDDPKLPASNQRNDGTNFDSILEGKENTSAVPFAENKDFQKLEKAINDILFKFFSHAREDVVAYENSMWNPKSAFETMKLLNKFLDLQDRVPDFRPKTSEQDNHKMVVAAFFFLFLSAAFALLLSCFLFFLVLRLKWRMEDEKEDLNASVRLLASKSSSFQTQKHTCPEEAILLD